MSSVRLLVALGLIALSVGCYPTRVTRTVVTTTKGDGSKETVDTKEVTQSLSKPVVKPVQNVLDME